MPSQKGKGSPPGKRPPRCCCLENPFLNLRIGSNREPAHPCTRRIHAISTACRDSKHRAAENRATGVAGDRGDFIPPANRDRTLRLKNDGRSRAESQDCRQGLRGAGSDLPGAVEGAPRRRHTPPLIGAWRSLVARFVRDEEVAGSNPVAPTNSANTIYPYSNNSNPTSFSTKPKWIRNVGESLPFTLGNRPSTALPGIGISGALKPQPIGRGRAISRKLG